MEKIEQWRSNLKKMSGSLTTNSAMPDELIEKLLQEDASLKEKISFENGEALVKLNKNYNLFIISSSRTKNLIDYLQNNNVGGIFKEVLGNDSHKSKIEKFKFIFAQYKLEPDDCIFIIDTLGDILEANVVGVKTIAVDFGYHGRETLSKGNPFKIVSSLDELMQTIEQN